MLQLTVTIEDAYVDAVEKASASTVSVRTAMGPMCPPFGPFPMRGVGSGIVLDREGHILTNEHVVADAKRILVTLTDGQVVGGTIVGGDEDTDIAVVKADASNLVPAEFGDSDSLRVGQPVLAIGNPLGLRGGPTVTSGVISSLRRSLHPGNGGDLQVVQTDAAINPGNSGGPLVDLKGRIVAIATAQMPHAEGIGFAVPSNAAKKAATEIIQYGRVRRPWLGIIGYEVNQRVAHYYGFQTPGGIFVTELPSEGPAQASGVRVGDVITEFAGRTVSNMEDLSLMLRTKKIGETAELEVRRHGETKRFQVTLGTRPA